MISLESYQVTSSSLLKNRRMCPYDMNFLLPAKANRGDNYRTEMNLDLFLFLVLDF
jgi:hypothetical protein